MEEKTMDLKKKTELAADAREAFAMAELMTGGEEKPSFTFCIVAQPYFTLAQRALNKAIRKKGADQTAEELCQGTLGVSWEKYNALSDRIHEGLRLNRTM